jgi:hypothetical protein
MHPEKRDTWARRTATGPITQAYETIRCIGV